MCGNILQELSDALHLYTEAIQCAVPFSELPGVLHLYTELNGVLFLHTELSGVLQGHKVVI